MIDVITEPLDNDTEALREALKEEGYDYDEISEKGVEFVKSLLKEKENKDVSKSIIMTDEFTGYVRLKKHARHRVINHQRGYVDGYIHTNTIEGFWALLKRGIIGQYHKVSVRYLNQYINEFCYRYNNRETENLFGLTIKKAVNV
ncbi:MAG TPA: IS1595 family transposase [bacterium]|nr:IS1595 family transposase [bacterium]